MPDSSIREWMCFFIISIIVAAGVDAFAQGKAGEEVLFQSDTLILTQPDTLVKEMPVEIQKLIETITTEKAKTTPGEPSLEIDGLVVDETRTKAGHDFYDNFYRLWEAPPQAKNFSIVIREIPFRANTTQVQILVNDELVVNSILQPKQDFISELAGMSVPAIGEYLIKLQEMARQLDDTDLSGSGIY